ncbi:hypothetical protein INS49_003893 [Diaporthe citri]|uniref:uncharacterized protein n=1 Tax=Diaporthe citri TaxID=83186 RepID=UPI001C7EAAF0|nr:uncharacterized protein INS49_003893 [Diaporthe citri]KAG6354812.1 hypothetical protein INS49_003893 [Diaporthe citri]
MQSSCAFDSGPWDGIRNVSVAPERFAKARRSSAISIATTRAAPNARATAQQRSPIGPAPKNGKAFALRVSSKTTAMHCDTQWLNGRPFAERNLAWKQMAAFFRENVVGRKGTVVWRCRGEFHIRAKVVTATPALLANIASSARLKSYSVAGSQVLDIGSAFFDDSCRFVAQDNGFIDDVSADSAMLPVMNLADEIVSVARIRKCDIGGHLTSEPQSPVTITFTSTSLVERRLGLERTS